MFAFVVSGARTWVDTGLEETGAAVQRQAERSFSAGTWPSPPAVLRVMAEKRATFRCTPELARPPAGVAPGLLAAGDYIQGPYPATLEGAVRSGEAAVAALNRLALPACATLSSSPPARVHVRLLHPFVRVWFSHHTDKRCCLFFNL